MHVPADFHKNNLLIQQQITWMSALRKCWCRDQHRDTKRGHMFRSPRQKAGKKKNRTHLNAKFIYLFFCIFQGSTTFLKHNIKPCAIKIEKKKNKHSHSHLTSCLKIIHAVYFDVSVSRVHLEFARQNWTSIFEWNLALSPWTGIRHMYPPS